VNAPNDPPPWSASERCLRFGFVLDGRRMTAGCGSAGSNRRNWTEPSGGIFITAPFVHCSIRFMLNERGQAGVPIIVGQRRVSSMGCLQITQQG
jgi:hypothetical protein